MRRDAASAMGCISNGVVVVRMRGAKAARTRRCAGAGRAAVSPRAPSAWLGGRSFWRQCCCSPPPPRGSRPPRPRPRPRDTSPASRRSQPSSSTGYWPKRTSSRSTGVSGWLAARTSLCNMPTETIKLDPAAALAGAA